jgi:DNA-binding transcriptional LysR family regulator
MELRHLRYFVAVAEAGSLTVAAGKKLHTAQPSLSRQIRDLEYEVGVPLMNRSVHGIELTAAGRAFLDHARLALTQAEAAADAARRAAQLYQTDFRHGLPNRAGSRLAASGHKRPSRRIAQYRNQGFKRPLDNPRRRPAARDA